MSLISAPIIPTASKEIAAQLGLEEPFHKRSWDDQMGFALPAGHRLGTPKPLFRKIEDEEIVSEEMALQSRSLPAPVPKLPTISIDDFRRVKMEVVEVVRVESVPNSQKLLLLHVATSLGDRQIVSGIAQAFQPNELVGKKLVACINLKPTRIKGVESQGMILTAENSQGALELLEMSSSTVGSEIG